MSLFSALVQRSTRALQPAATTVPIGTLYFVTDELVWERSNGTVWQSVSGTSGVSSIRKAGAALLTGAVTLTGGTNITLTQAGQDISIAGGGGGNIGDAVTSGTVGSILFVKTGPILGQDNATLFWNTSTKQLLLGGVTHDAAGPIELDKDAANAIFSAAAHGTTAQPGLMVFKSRGTHAAPTIIVTGDILGHWYFRAYSGSAYEYVANITVTVEGTVTGSAIPTRMTFSTTPAGSVSGTERLRIGSEGQLGIGGANYGAAGQVLTSGGASAAPSWASPFNGASVYSTVDQTGLSQGVWTAGSFTSEDYDTDTLHDNSTNPSRLTIPITGKWLIVGTLFIETNGVVVCNGVGLAIKINGAGIYGYTLCFPSAGTTTSLTTSVVLSLTAGQYAEIFGMASGSSGTYKILGSLLISRLSATYLGT